MKKTLLILCITLILSALILPVSSASSDILKGTPVIDGAKDAIYDQTVSVKCGETFYNTGDMDGNADATVYILYDDKYLYLYAEVIDDDVVAADPANLADGSTAWIRDVVELWIDASGNDDNLRGKFSIDFEGNIFFDDSRTPIDVKKTFGKAKIIPGGYSVELAVEFPAEYALKAGNSVGIAIQVNDFHADETVSAMGSQNTSDNILKLGAPVIPVEPEPEILVETAAEQETEANTAPPAVNAAPQTGDVTIIFSVISLLGAGGIFAFKKRKQHDIN